jgi:hypothetical protein
VLAVSTGGEHTALSSTTVPTTSSAVTATSSTTFLATTSTTSLATTTTPPPTTSTTTTTLGDPYGALDLMYFEEIVGQAEYGGEGGVVHKWTGDLHVAVYGEPTEEDREALSSVIDELNEILGPIEVDIVDSNPNLKIYFAPESQLAALEPNYVPGNLGYVWIWWDDGSITSGRVLISTTGTTSQERAHLIREELTQGLGLLNDSLLYPDSIFYQEWTTVVQYSPIDRLVIEMLYRPEVLAGMPVADAAEVLAGLIAG